MSKANTDQNLNHNHSWPSAVCNATYLSSSPIDPNLITMLLSVLPSLQTFNTDRVLMWE